MGTKIDLDGKKGISVVKLESLLTGKPVNRAVVPAAVKGSSSSEEKSGGAAKKISSAVDEESPPTKDKIVAEPIKELPKEKILVTSNTKKATTEPEVPFDVAEKDQKKKEKPPKRVEKVEKEQTVDSSDKGGATLSKKGVNSGDGKVSQKSVSLAEFPMKIPSPKPIPPVVDSKKAISGDALPTLPRVPSPERPSTTTEASKSLSQEKLPLPPNWEVRVDPHTGRSFYVNHEAKITQWNHPLDPPKKKSDAKKKNKKSRSTSAVGSSRSRQISESEDRDAVDEGAAGAKSAYEDLDLGESSLVNAGGEDEDS